MLKKSNLHICMDCYLDLEKNEVETLIAIEKIYIHRFGESKPITINQNVLTDSLLRLLESFDLVVSTEISFENIAVAALGDIFLDIENDRCFFCKLSENRKLAIDF